jgi:hypothetical protein
MMSVMTCQMAIITGQLALNDNAKSMNEAMAPLLAIAASISECHHL